MTHQTHILVVEDRADWREIVCEAVIDQGYQVHSTASYEDALAALAQQTFDLAVIDPVLDRANPFNRAGVSVIKTLRDRQPAIPVIVVTGSFTPDIKASLEAICPQAPVLFKESWNPAQFGEALNQQLHAEGNDPVPPDTPQSIAPNQSDQPLTPPAPEQAYGRPRVLVVENRQDWQDILADTLADEAYFWRVARSAEEALREMERENFHLVLLDLKLQANELPLRSSEGWLLLEHLNEVYPKTKVVIISGRAGAGDVAELLTHYPNILNFIDKERYHRRDVVEAVKTATQAPELRIQTFGQFKVWRDGGAIPGWERPQAETIAKLLLVRRAMGGRAVSSDELITRLWPDDNETVGRKKLLPLISNARKTLEPDIEPRDSNFILRSSTGYFFDLSGQIHWDLLEFRQHVSAGRQYFYEEFWEPAIAEFEKAVALYKGDFLAENRYDDWAIAPRHDIASEYRDLLIYLADANAELGRYPQAIKACETALRKDPLLESVYRRLMRFHVCNDEKGLALKTYRDCLMVFEEMFEESPTPATRQLYEAIAQDEEVDCHSER
jgi:two-component SAPR family response regulator